MGSRRLVLAANGARYRYITRRPTFWIVLAAVIAVILLGGTLAGFRPAVTLGLLLCAGVFYVWASWRQGVRAFLKVYPTGDKICADISVDGLTLTTPGGTYRAPWQRYAAADVVNGHLVLPLADSAATLVIPPELMHAGAYDVACEGIRAVRGG
ncbi:MAG: hypothetical protein ACK5MP_11065 [Nostocoides sp.]